MYHKRYWNCQAWSRAGMEPTQWNSSIVLCCASRGNSPKLTPKLLVRMSFICQGFLISFVLMVYIYLALQRKRMWRNERYTRCANRQTREKSEDKREFVRRRDKALMNRVDYLAYIHSYWVLWLCWTDCFWLLDALLDFTSSGKVARFLQEVGSESPSITDSPPERMDGENITHGMLICWTRLSSLKLCPECTCSDQLTDWLV